MMTVDGDDLDFLCEAATRFQFRPDHLPFPFVDEGDAIHIGTEQAISNVRNQDKST